MAFTTYSAFVTALAGLTVTGVTRSYTEPPTQISTAGVPAMFPRIPAGAGEVEVLSGGSEISRATAELVVAIEPVAQNMTSINFAAAVTMMDSLETAFRAAIVSVGIDAWTLQVSTVDIGVTPYWAVVATVEASG